MSVVDTGIFNQLKKGQGETNERLDKLIAAQDRTNQLLEWLGGLVQTPNYPGMQRDFPPN